LKPHEYNINIVSKIIRKLHKRGVVMKKPTCRLCNSSRHYCIPMLKTFICEECLNKITTIAIDDDDYDKVKDALRDVLRKNKEIIGIY